MLPKTLRYDLGDDLKTPSRLYNERLRTFYESLDESTAASNDTRGELIGDIRLLTTISANHIRKLQQDIVPRPSDVFVVCYPKSGTTWIQQIVKLIWNNGIEDGRDIDDVIPWIEPIEPELIETMSSPRGFKVHLPYHLTPGGDPNQSPAKYIYVYRNPKDAIVSNFHFSVKFFPEDIPWNDYFEKCVSGQHYYGIIFDHVRSWFQHKDAPNIFIISYEHLKKNTAIAVKEIANFLGYSLSNNVISSITDQVSFENMKSNSSCNNSFFDRYRRPGEPFMRKGVIGDWKTLFTSEQSSYVDQQVAEKLAPLGLKFDYD